MSLLVRAKNFIRHGRVTGVQYRAECFCGWKGQWWPTQDESDYEWVTHKRPRP